MVGLRVFAPFIERLGVGRWDARREDVSLHPMAIRQRIPVEIGPAIGIHPRGAVRNRLGAELRHEAARPRNDANRARHARHRAVVPAEPRMRVGPHVARAREHAGVAGDRSCAVAPNDRAGDRTVEHLLRPRRERCGREQLDELGALRELAWISVKCIGPVVCTPQEEAGVVREHVDHRARLPHCLPPNSARIAPLHREVLP